jgi:branched-chain amino acid transport system substrate-binding protein
MSRAIGGRPLALVAAVAAAAIVAGCGSNGGSSSSDSSSGGGGGSVTIGELLPLSGPAASTGIPTIDGAKLAAKEINDAGGVDAGGKKYTIKIAPYDDGGDPAQALTVTTRALESDKVHLLSGLVTSASTNAILPLVTQHESDLAVVLNGATLPEATKPTNVFRLQADVNQYQLRAAQYQQKLGWKSVGLVTDQKQAAYVEVMPKVAGLYKQYGITIADEEKSETGQTDFSSVIAKMRSKKMDGVNLRMYSDEELLFIKQARQVGWNVPITGVNLTPSDAIGKSIPASAMTNVYEIVPPTMAQLVSDGNPQATQLTAAYKQQFGSEPGSLTLNGYEGVKAMAAAIKQAGTTDPAKVIQALTALKPYGALYPVTPQNGNVFGPKREVVVKFYASAWKDGKIVKTEPVE